MRDTWRGAATNTRCHFRAAMCLTLDGAPRLVLREHAARAPVVEEGRGLEFAALVGRLAVGIKSLSTVRRATEPGAAADRPRDRRPCAARWPPREPTPELGRSAKEAA